VEQAPATADTVAEIARDNGATVVVQEGQVPAAGKVIVNNTDAVVAGANMAEAAGRIAPLRQIVALAPVTPIVTKETDATEIAIPTAALSTEITPEMVVPAGKQAAVAGNLKHVTSVVEIVEAIQTVALAVDKLAKLKPLQSQPTTRVIGIL